MIMLMKLIMKNTRFNWACSHGRRSRWRRRGRYFPPASWVDEIMMISHGFSFSFSSLYMYIYGCWWNRWWILICCVFSDCASHEMMRIHTREILIVINVYQFILDIFFFFFLVGFSLTIYKDIRLMFGWHFFFFRWLSLTLLHTSFPTYFFAQNIVYFSIGYMTFQSIVLWYSISFLLLFFIKCFSG